MAAKRRKIKQPITNEAIDLEVSLFDLGCSYKEQAVKGIEEAAEVLGAVQTWEHLVEIDDIDEVQAKWSILDEVTDCIQAQLNLLYILGFTKHDLNNAMQCCTDRNKSRGRL